MLATNARKWSRLASQFASRLDEMTDIDRSQVVGRLDGVGEPLGRSVTARQTIHDDDQFAGRLGLDERGARTGVRKIDKLYGPDASDKTALPQSVSGIRIRPRNRSEKGPRS